MSAGKSASCDAGQPVAVFLRCFFQGGLDTIYMNSRLNKNVWGLKNVSQLSEMKVLFPKFNKINLISIMFCKFLLFFSNHLMAKSVLTSFQMFMFLPSLPKRVKLN